MIWTRLINTVENDCSHWLDTRNFFWDFKFCFTVPPEESSKIQKQTCPFAGLITEKSCLTKKISTSHRSHVGTQTKPATLTPLPQTNSKQGPCPLEEIGAFFSKAPPQRPIKRKGRNSSRSPNLTYHELFRWFFSQPGLLLPSQSLVYGSPENGHPGKE